MALRSKKSFTNLRSKKAPQEYGQMPMSIEQMNKIHKQAGFPAVAAKR